MDAGQSTPPYFLGIDLGGTNIKSGVVDDQARALSSVSVATEAEHGPGVGIDNLVTAGKKAVAASGLDWDRITAVGLGSPGTMDLQAGMLLDPPNLPGWDNLPICKLLSDRLGKPVVLQNDGNAAAFGEYWAGAGRDTHSLVMFTLGTGVGGGIVIDGSIIEGRHSHGGECGHIIIEAENGRRCSCGALGHLEAYASAKSVVKRALERLDSSDLPSSLRRIEPHRLSSRAIAAAAADGDAVAKELMSETAHYLAVGAVSLDAHDRSRHRAFWRRDDRGGDDVSRRDSQRCARDGVSSSSGQDSSGIRSAGRRCRVYRRGRMGSGEGEIGGRKIHPGGRSSC